MLQLASWAGQREDYAVDRQAVKQANKAVFQLFCIGVGCLLWWAGLAGAWMVSAWVGVGYAILTISCAVWGLAYLANRTEAYL